MDLRIDEKIENNHLLSVKVIKEQEMRIYKNIIESIADAIAKEHE